MKGKFISSCAAVLLTASIFTACAGTSQKVIFSSNWQADNTVQNNQLTETLEYAVSFEKSSSNTTGYDVDYQNGKYTTKLSTEQLDGKTIYVYETSLNIEVIFDYNGEQTEPLKDSVHTLVKFEKADQALRPIFSQKTVVSHSPDNSASSLESCFDENTYVTTITYNPDYSGESLIVYTYQEDKNGEKETKTYEDKNSFALDTEKFTCLDNEQLAFALRGINPSLNSSAKFNVYSPYVKAPQSVKATFNTATSADFSFTRNGTAIKETIEYYPVSVVLNEKNEGATQTVWIAKSTSIQANTYRNVILKLEQPLSYGLGSLVYTLQSATFSN